MDDDWDLHAVVRSCSSSTTTATATAVDCGSSVQDCSITFGQECNFSSTWCQDLFEPRRDSFIEELHGLLKPFFPKPQDSSQFSQQNFPPISPLSVLGGLQDLPSEQQQQQVIKQIPLQKQQLFSVVSGAKPSPRKNHLKEVCHVPAESLSSDTWSWRKYGQKPIKGSPYPRGYYRCSTSKGCMARKQVERNRSDPGMFIVTYTGEHSHPMPTHRNSLAGSTRHKPAENSTSDNSKKPLEMLPEKLESSREDLAEVEEDDDDGFSVSKMAALDDDFFVGLEDFTGECLSDHIPTNSQFPWLANNAATTTTTTTMAGGGGG